MSRAQRLLRSALIFGAIGTLPACAPLNAPFDPQDDTCIDGPCITQRHDLQQLLRYTEQVSRMSEPAQQRQHILAQRAFTREGSPFNRVRLALLLALPGTPFQCDSCARDLLHDYLQPSSNDRVWRDFAALILRTTEQRLALQQALDTERKQHQQAHEQLEKLKAIEHRINDRDRATITEPKKTP